MSTVHRRYSKTSCMVATSMGALFIRVLFIVGFVYAWFLIARAPSSENNAVLFTESKFPSEKRVHENHLEVEKLIPVENTADLLHSTGLPPAPPPPTDAPFHEDMLLHEPPFEGPMETRRKQLITGPDDTISAVNGRQQYDIIKYESNIKPILEKSFREKNAMNLQVPIENNLSNNYVDLANEKSNTSSDLKEQHSSTTVSGNNDVESNTTPVSVFSNFKDKLLNIIRPKVGDSLESVTTDSKVVDLGAENQQQYSASRDDASANRANIPVDEPVTKSLADGTVSTRRWKEHDDQASSQERLKLQTQSADSENVVSQSGVKSSGKTEFLNKLFHSNNLKKTIEPGSKDVINIQSSQNQNVRQDTKLRPQINEEFHTRQPPLQVKEDSVQRQSFRNGVCPTGDIITVVGGGRLANCIWEYASLLSVNKFLPGNRTAYAQKYIMKYLSNIFENLNMPVVEEIPEDCACCKDVNWTSSNIHMYSFIPLREVQKTFENVPGHIILSKYIVLVEPVLATIKNLKKEMPYKHSLVQSAQNVIKSTTEEFLRKNDASGVKLTYVGVHVRRTDYKDYLAAKYNMTALGPEFYLKAMTYFRVHRPDLGRPIFLVVSDDVPWVEKNVIQNDVFVVSRGDADHPEHDLILLSLCNHSIIDYGTFGLWAAVYAGGETVTIKTSMHVYQILGRKPNWHFVSVNPGVEIEIY